jgi:diguanylate cyclase (GGDEF)-like protein/PAS domain S-box-containing protein
MEQNQTRLSRLQLFGTLLIVFLVAMSMSGYFLVLHWRDFSMRQQAVTAQSVAWAREHLKSNSEQTVLMLGALRENASAALKERVRARTDQAWDVAHTIWFGAQGRHSKAEIGRIIANTLFSLSMHRGSNYSFILTLDGHPVLTAAGPENPARPRPDLRDDVGRPIAPVLIAAANNPDGSGYSYYRWPLPGQTRMADKISYVRRFEPLNWLIGSGEYVAFADADLQRQGLDLLTQMRRNTNTDYIVLDRDGRLLMYPDDPSMLGQHFLALPPRMRAAVIAMLDKSRNGGFLDYVERGHPALAYVRKLPGWDWTLVTSLPTQQLLDRDRAAQQDLYDALYRRITATLLMTFVALSIAALFSWIFARWMNALFARYRHDLWTSHHELKERSRELLLSRFMMDNAAEIVCLMDQHARLAYENDIARACLGAPGQKRDQRIETLFRGPGQAPLPQTYQISLPDDEDERIFEVTQHEIHYEGERYRAVIARDISERVRAERDRRLAARVFETSTEAIMIADRQNRILTVNKAFVDSTGYSESELIGNTPSLLASGRHSRNFYDEMWKLLREHGKWSGEIWNRRKNGEIFPEWLTISVMSDERGKVSNYVALFTDISERKRQEAQMRYMTEYDYLTDLPNRALINDRLQQALADAQSGGWELAVLFVDLDHFKNVNDALGHNLGDELLKEVAHRLSQILREVDSVGRSGGDEFVVLLPRLAKHEEAAQVAERILHVMRQPFVIAGHAVRLSASIGISLCPKDGRDLNGLMMSADLAMYHAKAGGRDTFRFYSSQMNAQFNERLMLESRLREALDAETLELVYQPLFTIDGQRIVGCEALLRWLDPEIGPVAPMRFIPVAEETGMIDRLGALVLEQVCAQIARWRAAGLPLVPVTLNIAASQLAAPDLVDTLRAALARHDLSGDSLVLDLNEDALMTNPARTTTVLDRIRACGVGLAIDNFGIGYSSPAHLKRFAPGMIKIDRSFVGQLPGDEDCAAVVSAIVHLASALGIPTLAQGVENEQQRKELERMGCRYYQGFLSAVPQDASGMAQWLERGRALQSNRSV